MPKKHHSLQKKGIVHSYALALCIDQGIKTPGECPWKKCVIPQNTVFVAFCAEVDLQVTVKRLGDIGNISSKKKGLNYIIGLKRLRCKNVASC